MNAYSGYQYASQSFSRAVRDSSPLPRRAARTTVQRVVRKPGFTEDLERTDSTWSQSGKDPSERLGCVERVSAVRDRKVATRMIDGANGRPRDASGESYGLAVRA